MADDTGMPWGGHRAQRMEYIFNTGFLSDAVLQIGLQKQEVNVHKFVLQFASPVFYNKFQKVGNNPLVLSDVDPEIFIKFLKHLYLGDSGAAIEECFPLLDIATRYQVQDLIYFCSDKLNGNFTEDNVTTLFQQAMEFGHEELTEATLAYLCRNAYNIVDSDGFLQLRQECLYEIVKRDDLRVNNELHIFNAVLRWGEAECNRQNLDPDDPENLRKVVTKVMGLIRFPVMEAEEFTLNVAMRNILAERELISMLLFFNVSVGKRAAIPQGRFNASPRNYNKSDGSTGQQRYPPLASPRSQAPPQHQTFQQTSNPYSASSGSSIQSTSSVDRTHPRAFKASRLSANKGIQWSTKLYPSMEALKLKSNKAIVITGFQLFNGIFPGIQGNFSAELFISIQQMSNKMTITSEKRDCSVDRSAELWSPAFLEANSWYLITVTVANKERGPTQNEFSFGAASGPPPFYAKVVESLVTSIEVPVQENGRMANYKFEFGRIPAEQTAFPIQCGIIQDIIFHSME